MTPFKLEIITPDRVFFDDNTENVIVRTTVGDKGILAHHEPYVAALNIGKIKVMIDGKYRVAAISGGVIKVGRDKTTILAQSCEWADEIDVERAKHAKEVAEERMAAKTSQRDFDIAEYKLKRALNRIDAANNK
ncbi:MAG: ATP synthase F1 subunit epsilon [Ruminiclostridium sp.]